MKLTVFLLAVNLVGCVSTSISGAKGDTFSAYCKAGKNIRPLRVFGSFLASNPEGGAKVPHESYRYFESVSDYQKRYSHDKIYKEIEVDAIALVQGRLQVCYLSSISLGVLKNVADSGEVSNLAQLETGAFFANGKLVYLDVGRNRCDNPLLGDNKSLTPESEMFAQYIGGEREYTIKLEPKDFREWNFEISVDMSDFCKKAHPKSDFRF